MSTFRKLYNSLVDTVGRLEAMNFVTRHTMQKVYIPVRLSNLSLTPIQSVGFFNDLIKICGESEALKLLQKFRGRYIRCPKTEWFRFGTIENRNRKIIQMSKSGSSCEELSQQFNLTEGRVYQILRSGSNMKNVKPSSK